MNIGLYHEPINATLSNYKGLYRQNNIVDLMESDHYNLTSAIDWFFSVSREGSFLKYNEKNCERLLKLYSILKEEKWLGEIVIFTDCCSAIIPSGFGVLGYDICTDSKYYSPIGDGFLQSYDKDNPFFIEMSVSEFDCYKNDINDAGLFNTYSIALDFSKYCNVVNDKYEHAVETETNWRPFTICKWRDI